MSVPALQTPPKFHEKTPRERRKNEISGGREKKKARNFWPPTLRAPTPPGPHPFGPPPKTKLAKCGLAKFGQQKLAKFSQIRMAKCGQLTLAKCGIGQIRFDQMRPNEDGQIRIGQIRSRPTRVALKIFICHCDLGHNDTPNLPETVVLATILKHNIMMRLRLHSQVGSNRREYHWTHAQIRTPQKFSCLRYISP